MGPVESARDFSRRGRVALTKKRPRPPKDVPKVPAGLPYARTLIPQTDGTAIPEAVVIDVPAGYKRAMDELVDETARCYGQRMLSPFRGVMHCVVTEWADAVTIDGRAWTLYVRGECLYDNPEEVRDQAISVPDVKYGTWSEAAGFQRAPIRLPTFEAKVCGAGGRLLEAVQRNAGSLPFPVIDRFELWLLHEHSDKPLALIASACDLAEREMPNLLRWTPGRLCLEARPATQSLVARVAELAGKEPHARWFERRPDGSGVPCIETDEGTTAAPISASEFGRFEIDESAFNAAQIDLLRVVEDWQAPSLLQLPDLPVAERRALEAAACHYALRLAEQLPLYPCVLDRAAITAALVEARMRQSQISQTEVEGAERALSPYYLEIADD